MIKKIKAHGSSKVIIITAEELQFYGLEIGDWVKVAIQKVEEGEDAD